MDAGDIGITNGDVSSGESFLERIYCSSTIKNGLNYLDVMGDGRTFNINGRNWTKLVT